MVQRPPGSPPSVCRPELLREDTMGPSVESSTPHTQPRALSNEEKVTVPGKQDKLEKQFWCGGGV